VVANQEHFSLCQPHNLLGLLTQSGIGFRIAKRAFHITILTTSNIQPKSRAKMGLKDGYIIFFKAQDL